MKSEEEFKLLAQELKSLCDDGKETDQNLERTTEILFRFGQLHKSDSPDKISLIRSAAFYNAALVRRPENNEIKHELVKLCDHILEISNAQNTNVNLCQIADDIKKLIMEMRDHTNESLRKLEIIPLGLPFDKLQTMEKQKINQVQTLQNEISKKFTHIMDFVSNRCIEIMGTAPCRYSVVGMGSLARKEITPYSDFEHVIILEDNVEESRNYPEIVEYFRWFTVIFHVVIINLQESIVRSVASPFLNDDLTAGGDWYFDAYTTCGIKFDGMQIHACKFPLGRFRTTKTITTQVELIQPVSKMVEFLKAEEEGKNGFHLGDVLTKTCFVSGDQKLCREFQNKVIETVRSEGTRSNKEIIKMLDEDLSKFNLLMRVASTNASVFCDIKRLLYRTTTLFISTLGRLTRINESSSFDIVNCLLNRNIINNNTAHQLAYSVSIACETRLKVYMKKNGQDDFYGERDYEYSERKTLLQLIDLIGEQSLSDYLIIAYTWQKAIKRNDISCLYDCISKDYDKFHVLWSFDLQNRFEYEWKSYYEKDLLKPDDESFFILYAAAKMHIRKDKFSDALDVFKMISNLTLRDNFEQNNHEIACLRLFLIADSLKEKAQCLVRLERWEEAILFIDKAQLQLPNLELVDDEYNSTSGLLFFLKGQSLENVGQVEEAVSIYEQCMACYERCENPFSKNWIIKGHTRLANCKIKIGNLLDAINHLKIVYDLHFKATVEISLIANCCRVLYEILTLVDDHETAKFYLEKELDLRMQHVSVEEQSNNEDILFCKQHLSSVSA